jgi:hypothetical protein
MHTRTEGISVSPVSRITMDHGTELLGAPVICRPPPIPDGEAVEGLAELSILAADPAPAPDAL